MTFHSLSLRVEQVGDAVQGDDGFPGTGATFDHQHPGCSSRTMSSCSAWIVATMSRMPSPRGALTAASKANRCGCRVPRRQGARVPRR